jgi:hypothetical protein
MTTHGISGFERCQQHKVQKVVDISINNLYNGLIGWESSTAKSFEVVSKSC